MSAIVYVLKRTEFNGVVSWLRVGDTWSTDWRDRRRFKSKAEAWIICWQRRALGDTNRYEVVRVLWTWKRSEAPRAAQ